MGRKRDKQKWPKDPEMVMKKIEEHVRENLKDLEWKAVSPKLKWKIQHRLNRMLKNIMYDIWAENFLSVTQKPDGSIELNMVFPAEIAKLGLEENGEIKLKGFHG